MMRCELEGLEQEVRRIEGRAAKAIERPFRAELRRILTAAKLAWPVRTGRSRRRIRGEVYLTPAGVVVEASCDVEYATFIREDGHSTWGDLVRGPVLSMGRRLEREIVREVAAAVEDRR